MIIQAEWQAPHNISAFTTTRVGGISNAPYHHFNLALHTGDDSKLVESNRHQLIQTFHLPSSPCWLNQTHSDKVVYVDRDEGRDADAAISQKPGQVLAIMTADCMPILICNQQGDEIAGIHAGWRGLARGIIEKTVDLMQSQAHELIAWIGPAVCGACFEVGNDVKSTLINQYGFAEDAFLPTQLEHKWLGNMAFIAKKILNQIGIQKVFESRHCTMEESNLFYSYRREGITGRMASLIWLNA